MSQPAQMALQRLQREIVELQGSHILGIHQHEDDFHVVEITIQACGKNFTIQFDIPYDYPFCPPEVRFLTPANLRCIDPSSGKVCLVRTTWHGWTATTHIRDILEDIEEEINLYIGKKIARLDRKIMLRQRQRPGGVGAYVNNEPAMRPNEVLRVLQAQEEANAAVLAAAAARAAAAPPAPEELSPQERLILELVNALPARLLVPVNAAEHERVVEFIRALAPEVGIPADQFPLGAANNRRVMNILRRVRTQRRARNQRPNALALARAPHGVFEGVGYRLNAGEAALAAAERNSELERELEEFRRILMPANANLNNFVGINENANLNNFVGINENANLNNFVSINENENENENANELNNNLAGLQNNLGNLLEEQGLDDNLAAAILDENVPLLDDQNPLNAIVNMGARILDVLRTGVANLEEQARLFTTFIRAVLGFLQGNRNVLNADVRAQIQNLQNRFERGEDDLQTLFVGAVRILLHNLPRVNVERQTLFAFTAFLFQIVTNFAQRTRDALAYGFYAAGRLMLDAGAGVAQGMVRVGGQAAGLVYNVAEGALDGLGNVAVRVGEAGAAVVERVAEAGPIVREAANQLRGEVQNVLAEGLRRGGQNLRNLVNLLRDLAQRGGVAAADLARIGLVRLGQGSRAALRLLARAIRTGSLSLMRLAGVMMRRAYELAATIIGAFVNLGVRGAQGAFNLVYEGLNFLLPALGNLAMGILNVGAGLLRDAGVALVNAGGRAIDAGIDAAAVYGPVAARAVGQGIFGGFRLLGNAVLAVGGAAGQAIRAAGQAIVNYGPGLAEGVVNLGVGLARGVRDNVLVPAFNLAAAQPAPVYQNLADRRLVRGGRVRPPVRPRARTPSPEPEPAPPAQVRRRPVQAARPGPPPPNSDEENDRYIRQVTNPEIRALREGEEFLRQQGMRVQRRPDPGLERGNVFRRGPRGGTRKQSKKGSTRKRLNRNR